MIRDLVRMSDLTCFLAVVAKKQMYMYFNTV